jgi:hypothetical protein
MKDLSKDLFVTWVHVHKLLNKSESTAQKAFRDIRITFGVVRPRRVTRDQVCLFFTITLEQYINQLRA